MEFKIRQEEFFIFLHEIKLLQLHLSTLNYNNSGKFPEFTNDTENKKCKSHTNTLYEQKNNGKIATPAQRKPS